MPPKTATVNGSSTVAANGRPKRKRTRTRRRRPTGAAAIGKGKSSDESSDDDSDGDEPKASTSLTEKQKGKKAESATSSSSDSSEEETAKPATVAVDGNDSDSSSSASSSSSSSFLTTSSDEEDTRIQQPRSGKQVAATTNGFSSSYTAEPAAAAGRPRAPSPTRPPSPPLIQFGLSADDAKYARALGKPILWGHLPSDVAEDPNLQQEQQAAEAEYAKFREHYVSRLISRFGGSLDQIRQKEGNDLSESRLQVLIRSIADGSDAFSSRRANGIWKETGAAGGEREMVLDALEVAEGEAAEGANGTDVMEE